MKSEILSLGKHSLVYGLGIVISKLASFIMLPVYTRYLTPADYGTAELLTTTIDVIGMIAGIGVAATIFKYYAEYDHPEEKNEVISTALLMVFALSAVTAIFGILFSGEISKLIFGNVDNNSYFKLVFIIYFMQQGVVTIPLMFIRALQRSKLFLLISITKLFIQVSLNFLFLVVLGKGLLGILYSSILSEALIGSYLAIYVFRSVGVRFSTAKAKKMIQFGYPFIFTSLSSFILTYSDRYFLNANGDLAAVGVYALAYKFGFLLGYFTVGPFFQIWEPRRFELAKQDNSALLFKKIFLYLNIIVILFSLLFVLFIKDFLTIMADPAYWEAHKIVPIIVVAYIFQAWTYYCNFGFFHGGRSNQLAFLSILSAAFVILLNFIFIPVYGVYGAAWATVGAFFFRFVLVYLFSQKLYFIDYGWGKQVTLFLLSSCTYLLHQALTATNIVLSLLLNSSLIFFFCIAVYLVLLGEEEKIFLRQLARRFILYPRPAG